MKEAKFIVETLTKRGFLAYFAGGWVRDFLLKHPSDDIDIATNASPEDVKAIFSHTIPIGEAFGIMLVIINNKKYEVATFRQDVKYVDGRRPAEIKFASAEEDAKRRDFTINGMFFDPVKEEVIDYINGRKDLENKIIRAIGNPEERFQEDRLRMIRAVRMSARFNFDIEDQTKAAIKAHAKNLFPSVAIERVVQEFTKMGAYRGFKKALQMLSEFELLAIIFPELKKVSHEAVVDRLDKVDDYPSSAPVIISLLDLFPEKNLADQLELCKLLKLSNREMNFIEFLHKAHQLCENNPENYLWANFYAHPFSGLALQVLAVRTSFEKRNDFLKNHEKRKKNLQNFIDRIINKTPLIKSDYLKLSGISQGKEMGILLQQAERISINENIESPLEVLEKLKATDFWPKIS